MQIAASVTRFTGMLLIALGCAAGTASATDLSRPLTLVAAPGLQGSGFEQTVLLAAPLPNGMHIGFIVNRPTEVALAAAFPGHPPSGKVRDPVYLGGPFMTETVFAAVRTAPADADAANLVELMPGLVLAMDAHVIDRIIETTPNDARYFAGLIVWQPGELDEEVAAGAWEVSPADAETVFAAHPEMLWQTLSRGGVRLEARAQPQRLLIHSRRAVDPPRIASSPRASKARA
jgi:putative transcriptional regulator